MSRLFICVSFMYIGLRVMELAPLSQQDTVQLPGCPPIVSRSEWDAKNATKPISNHSSTPDYVIFHHSGTSRCFTKEDCTYKVQTIQTWFITYIKQTDLDYSFLVGEDGYVYEGRGWDKRVDNNDGNSANRIEDYNSLAICMIGTFDDHDPYSKTITTLKQLLTCAVDNGKVTPNYILRGHRDLKIDEICPGNHIQQEIQSWPNYP